MMDPIIEAIHISYNVPMTWLLTGLVSGMGIAIQIYATFRILINRVDKLEKEVEKLTDLLDDVAYIKGKISKM
jgi:hypothetical protein